MELVRRFLFGSSELVVHFKVLIEKFDVEAILLIAQ